VRLRIELDDRPGSLAGIAAAIAGRDGNITSIDVLEADGGRVVDEITIEAPDDLDMTLLRGDIAGVRGARVVSHQRAELQDAVVRVLRRLALAAERAAEDRRAELRTAVAELSSTPAVAVLDAADASTYPISREALADAGRAVIARAADDLPPLGESMAGEMSVVAVATRIGADAVVVVVARPFAQGFTPTECERIEAFVALYERLVPVIDFARHDA